MLLRAGAWCVKTASAVCQLGSRHRSLHGHASMQHCRVHWRVPARRCSPAAGWSSGRIATLCGHARHASQSASQVLSLENVTADPGAALGQDGNTQQGVIDDQQASLTDALSEPTYGNETGDERPAQRPALGTLELPSTDDIVRVSAEDLSNTVSAKLADMGIPSTYPDNDPTRGVFCNRTLNMRAIRAVGFDMDYTLIHYDVAAWEGKAYAYGLRSLAAAGFPVEGLRFDDTRALRGLVVDVKRGSLVKIDRFGLVKRAMHGERMLAAAEVRKMYGRDLVSLSEGSRWKFLNTLFSVSEGCLYMQMVHRMDQGRFPTELGVHTYQALWASIQAAMFQTHVESSLKHDIIREPERYVQHDPDLAQALLDLKQAGKKLLLITNSDWIYTKSLMSYAYDRYLPRGMSWRDLFNIIFVQARKPSFWSAGNALLRIVSEDGLMEPTNLPVEGGCYFGGSAQLVERGLGMNGDQLLYVGDHIYTDAALAKLNFKWRTALIIRELEQEVAALARGSDLRRRLKELLRKKEDLGELCNQLRAARSRRVHAAGRAAAPVLQDERLEEQVAALLALMERLDDDILPLIQRDGEHFSKRWGYLSITGVNDKSQLQHQVEKYADVYTSRVSNFVRYTPYCHFRSHGQSLTHYRKDRSPSKTSMNGNMRQRPEDDLLAC